MILIQYIKNAMVIYTTEYNYTPDSIPINFIDHIT